MIERRFAKMDNLGGYIDKEIALAKQFADVGDKESAFHHLERAHVLGQGDTYQHTRIHWLMLKHGLRHSDVREVAGQVLRIAGASTKTPFGIYPKGNTGGANVSPFKPMPIPDDLAEIINATRS